MHSKTCFKCTVDKPIAEFYTHSAMADGHLNKCKSCAKRDAAAHRAANLDGARQYDRLRANQPHRIALRASVVAQWQTRHPQRRAANLEVGNAVRRGDLTPLPCLICGERAVAHHPDYDRPLDVVWLCQAHHKQAHAIKVAA